MASHTAFSNQNILIPRKSSVTAQVTGQSTKVRVTAFIAGPGFVPQDQSSHPGAWNQTWKRPLAGKGAYSVVIDIDFLAKASVGADLRVVEPGGSTWLSPWIVPLTGLAGDSITLSYGLAVL